jgi:esterase/lipase
MDFRGFMLQDFLLITLINKKDEVVNCRFYPSKGSKTGVIFVGGIGGDFDSPAKNLYSKLAAQLCHEDINALRIEFRYPTDIDESVQDVLLGVRFLESEGAISLGLVGHSFGGAVVVQAASKSIAVKTVVTLATQSYGAEAVEQLSEGTSIMLVHGTDDETLSPQNSELIYKLASEPKELLILQGNGHDLVESAAEVYDQIHKWLIKQLSR